MIFIYLFLFILFVILIVSIYLILKEDKDNDLIEKVKNLSENQIENIVKKTNIDEENFLMWLKELDIRVDILKEFKTELSKIIVWLDELKNSILVGILANGHILVEWVPWLAKTKTISSIASILDLQFSRLQFTPDMMPADIIWSEIYNQKKWDFEIKLGPIYTNILLADEINRTTPKVQSALLEAMQERKINISWKEFDLPNPFFVLATQNPIEQEWTYPLPEAQLDRFLFKVVVSYPNKQQEMEVLNIIEKEDDIKLNKLISRETIIELQQKIKDIKVSENIKRYIVELVNITRKSHQNIVYWLSPRAGISMLNASKALAFLKWKEFVDYEDVQQVALLTSRHRLILSYDAKLDWLTPDDVLVDLFKKVSL